MKTLLALALSLAVLPPTVSAAEAKKEISVRAISFDPDFPVEIHAHDPAGSATAGPVQVKSFLNHEINLLKLKGNSVIFTLKSNPVSATDVSDHLGKVEFPANTKSVILLFLPDSQEEGKKHYRVVAIDDSAKAFPSGSFNIRNVSDVAVKFELENDVHEILPGEGKVIAKPPFGENQAASMRAYGKRDGTWQVISAGSWANPGTRRVLQIAFGDGATGKVELKGIRDVVVP